MGHFPKWGIRIAIAAHLFFVAVTLFSSPPKMEKKKIQISLKKGTSQKAASSPTTSVTQKKSPAIPAKKPAAALAPKRASPTKPAAKPAAPAAPKTKTAPSSVLAKKKAVPSAQKSLD